ANHPMAAMISPSATQPAIRSIVWCLLPVGRRVDGTAPHEWNVASSPLKSRCTKFLNESPWNEATRGARTMERTHAENDAEYLTSLGEGMRQAMSVGSEQLVRAVV